MKNFFFILIFKENRCEKKDFKFDKKTFLQSSDRCKNEYLLSEQHQDFSKSCFFLLLNLLLKFVFNNHLIDYKSLNKLR